MSRKTYLLVFSIVAAACGETAPADAPSRDAGAREDRDAAEPDPRCTNGALSCEGDTLRVCDLGTWLRRKECFSGCVEQSPGAAACNPDACDGRTSICTPSGELMNCRTRALTPCSPGVCGDQASSSVCGAVDGACAIDGRYLPCLEASGEISPQRACDYAANRCVDIGQYDCATLVDSLRCIDGSFFASPCTESGQPLVLSCSERNAACSESGPLFCESRAEQAPCGDASLCEKAWGACWQVGAQAPTCVSEAIACPQDYDVAICTTANEGAACVDGYAFVWESLRSAGGSCDPTNDHIVIGPGGLCIPGLVPCVSGLYCKPTLMGECVPVEPESNPACNLDRAATLAGEVCEYEWNNCRNGDAYAVDCRRTGVSGQAFTLCTCKKNGEDGDEFISSEICSITELRALDALIRRECGWELTTQTFR